MNKNNLVLIQKINYLINIKYLQKLTYSFLQTYIGNVAVSVNPYKTLEIYNEETIEKYRGRNFYELPPHM